MCLALVAIGQHPKYPLILLSNRDEFYNRASRPADYWHDDRSVFAGRDLVTGGSWLGVNKKGGFALVTNYRNPNAYNALMQSRGHLVSHYLLNQKLCSPDQYIKTVAATAHNYNPFNLIVGTMNKSTYYSSVDNKVINLKAGLYGLSNHLLDTPWYKVLHAKELFSKTRDKLIDCTEPEALGNLLLPILEDSQRAPDNLLPQTGLTEHLEKALSSIFVDVPEHHYGSRSSSLILFTKDTLFFTEKTFLNAQMISSRHTEIKIS